MPKATRPPGKSNPYPRGTVDGRYDYMHRHVMARYLGRRLRRSEDVHHLNENKADYRLGNLLVIDHRHHGYLSAAAQHKLLPKLRYLCKIDMRHYHRIRRTQSRAFMARIRWTDRKARAV